MTCNFFMLYVVGLFIDRLAVFQNLISCLYTVSSCFLRQHPDCYETIISNSLQKLYKADLQATQIVLSSGELTRLILIFGVIMVLMLNNSGILQ